MELNADPKSEANFEARWSQIHVVNDDNDEQNDTTKEEFPTSSLDRHLIKRKLNSRADLKIEINSINNISSVRKYNQDCNINGNDIVHLVIPRFDGGLGSLGNMELILSIVIQLICSND